MYYLLYAGTGGAYIDDAATSGIMSAFLEMLTPTWLVASPASGSVNAGSSTDITIHFDAAELSPGTQQGSIVISSNDPDEPSATVPVTLHVGAQVAGAAAGHSGSQR